MTTPTTFRTEFATEGRWYTNALRFDDVEAAMKEAKARFAVWLVPVAWRVVTDDTATGQGYRGDSDPTSFKITNARGEELS